jgi:hypothetical protein
MLLPLPAYPKAADDPHTAFSCLSCFLKLRYPGDNLASQIAARANEPNMGWLASGQGLGTLGLLCLGSAEMSAGQQAHRVQSPGNIRAKGGLPRISLFSRRCDAMELIRATIGLDEPAVDGLIPGRRRHTHTHIAGLHTPLP